MGAVEHALYVLVCTQCRTPEWRSGARRRVGRICAIPPLGLDVTDKLERCRARPSGPRSFYGRPLVCNACGIAAESTEIDSALFFSIECPGAHKFPTRNILCSESASKHALAERNGRQARRCKL